VPSCASRVSWIGQVGMRASTPRPPPPPSPPPLLGGGGGGGGAAGRSEAAPRAFVGSVELAHLLRIRFWRVRVSLRTPQVRLVELGMGIWGEPSSLSPTLSPTLTLTLEWYNSLSL